MQKLLVIFILSFSIVFQSAAQSWLVNAKEYNSKRALVSTVVLATGWTGTIATLSSVWYTAPKDKFTFFNDANNWMQMDKVGHFYAASQLTQRGVELFKWAGVSKQKSLLFGSIFGLGFQTSFELLDGFSPNYGFSWSDAGANALGTANYVAQDLLWDEQKVKLKFSAHPTDYAKYRPNVLGQTFAERVLKDYNGQTYWISFSPVTLFNLNTNFPEWINLSFGYSVEELLYGNIEETYLIDIPWRPYRKYLLSLDIDLEKLNVKKPWLIAFFKQVNTLKIPLPTIGFSERGTKLYGLYF